MRITSLTLALTAACCLGLAGAADSQTSSRKDRSTQAPKRLRGKVVRTDEVKARGADVKHLLMVIETKEGQKALVDVGPKSELGEVSIRKGDTVSVTAFPVRLPTYPVFLAHRVTDGKTKVTIKRDGQSDDLRQFAGEVEQTWVARIRGQSAKHLMAELDTPGGKRTVDLGPKDKLGDLRIRTGDRITVRGRTIPAGRQPVYIASRVTAGGETADVNVQKVVRRLGEHQSASGEVKSTKQVSVQGQDVKHTVALVQGADKKRIIVDLGPTNKLRQYGAKVEKGDKIGARGYVFQIGQYRVLKAKRLSLDGKAIALDRPERTGGRARTFLLIYSDGSDDFDDNDDDDWYYDSYERAHYDWLGYDDAGEEGIWDW